MLPGWLGVSVASKSLDAEKGIEKGVSNVGKSIDSFNKKQEAEYGRQMREQKKALSEKMKADKKMKAEAKVKAEAPHKEKYQKYLSDFQDVKDSFGSKTMKPDTYATWLKRELQNEKSPGEKRRDQLEKARKQRLANRNIKNLFHTDPNIAKQTRDLYYREQLRMANMKGKKLPYNRKALDDINSDIYKRLLRKYKALTKTK